MIKLAVYILLIGMLSGCFSNVYEDVEEAANHLYHFNSEEFKNSHLFSINYTKKLDTEIISTFGLVRIIMWDELLAFASIKTQNGFEDANSKSEILVNSNILSSDIRYIMRTSHRKSNMADSLINQSHKDNKKELDFFKGLAELKEPESKEKIKSFRLCFALEFHTTIRDLNSFYGDLPSTIKKALHQDTMNNLYNSFN